MGTWRLGMWIVEMFMAGAGGVGGVGGVGGLGELSSVSEKFVAVVSGKVASGRVSEKRAGMESSTVQQAADLYLYHQQRHQHQHQHQHHRYPAQAQPSSALSSPLPLLSSPSPLLSSPLRSSSPLKFAIPSSPPGPAPRRFQSHLPSSPLLDPQTD